jgi:hypothetical protein
VSHLCIVPRECRYRFVDAAAGWPADAARGVAAVIRGLTWSRHAVSAERRAADERLPLPEAIAHIIAWHSIA